LLTAALIAWSAPALAAPKDTREMKARELYAAGRYQEALDIYIKLYAEKLHPNYLRNIWRCDQNLGDPEKAIGSFREYLRKARSLPPEEREEIEGYIREMEELKRQREAQPPPPPKHEEPTPHPPPPLVKPPEQQLIITPPPPKPEESPPVYKRWWFWTAVGVAVVAGTVGGLAAAGTFKSKGKDPECGMGRICP
jgi:tetratricopeptide (TPR) repeat protein